MEYDAYSLRVWRRRGGSEADWVCRLRHLQSGAELRFASREALIAHLAASLPTGGGESEPVREEGTGQDEERR